MSNRHFRRETRINRPALGSLPIHVVRGIVRIDQIIRQDSQTLKISTEERRIGIEIQNAGNANPKMTPIFHALDSPTVLSRPNLRRDWVGNILWMAGPPNLPCGDVYQVGICLTDYF